LPTKKPTPGKGIRRPILTVNTWVEIEDLVELIPNKAILLIIQWNPICHFEAPHFPLPLN
jgi:hypothetical protein